MIAIYPGVTNSVALTLNEKKTSNNTDVLFEFINQSSGLIKLFTQTDISPATSRYNLFEVRNTTTENFYNGQVNLTPAGSWLYNVYEMPVSSPPDLNPNNAIKLLEQGKVQVRELTATSSTFTSGDSINNVIFDI